MNLLVQLIRLRGLLLVSGWRKMSKNWHCVVIGVLVVRASLRWVSVSTYRMIRSK